MKPGTALPISAALIGTHPLLIWALSHGDGRIVGIILYFLLCHTLIELLRHGDVRSMMTTAFCFGAMLIADARLFFILLSLVPFLAFFTPPEMQRKSTHSFFLVILFPAIALLWGFFYLHLFASDVPFGFMQLMGTTETPHPNMAAFPWKQHYTGLIYKPGTLMLLGALLAFPLAIIAPVVLRKERLASIPLMATAAVPIIAAILAVKYFYPDYPAIILIFLSAPTWFAAKILLMRGYTSLVLVLLLAGWLGGKYMLSLFPFSVVQWILSSGVTI